MNKMLKRIEAGIAKRKYDNLPGLIGVVVNHSGTHWTLLLVDAVGNAYHLDSMAKPGKQNRLAEKVKALHKYVGSFFILTTSSLINLDCVPS